MSIVRPRGGRRRALVGRLTTLPHRARSLRWIAAGGAAVFTLIALDQSGSTDLPARPGPVDASAAVSEMAGRLPAATGGVVVPVSSPTFVTGDKLDVYDVRTASTITTDALVVGTSEGEAVIAVPDDLVADVVDALTTGGVVLVLVPSPLP